MKKSILLAVGLLIAVISYSQKSVYYVYPSGTTYDTLTGADTGDYQYPKTLNHPYGYAVQHATVKITGTGASTGSYTQGSLDGTNWVNIDSIQTIANGSGYRTITNISTGVMYPYLRVYTLQTGTTETTKQKVYFEVYPRYDAFYSNTPPVYQLVTDDTLTNTEAVSGSYPAKLNGVYAYTAQITVDELSGTATNTVTVQTSNDNTNWTTLETFTITSDTTVMSSSLTGTTGKYFRVYFSQSGTGTMECNAYVKLALRKY